MNVGICTYNIKQTKKLLSGANHDQLDGYFFEENSTYMFVFFM